MASKIDVRARLAAITLPDEDLSTTRLAELLGVNWETVHRAVARGELPPPVNRQGQRRLPSGRWSSGMSRYVFEREALVAAQREAS